MMLDNRSKRPYPIWEKIPKPIAVLGLIVVALLVIFLPLWGLETYCSSQPDHALRRTFILLPSGALQRQGPLQNSTQAQSDGSAGPSDLATPVGASTGGDALSAEGARASWWTRIACDIHATDYAIAMFTLLLVVVGSFQVIFVWGAFHESRSASSIARSAARTASIQVKAMIELERARVGFGSITIIKKIGTAVAPMTVGNLSTDSIYLHLVVTNGGRTGAFARTIRVEWRVASTLPEQPVYNTHPVAANLYIAPVIQFGQIAPTEFALDQRAFHLDQTQINRIRTATDFLFVYGYVEFEDFVGDTYRQGFVGRWEEVATAERSQGRGLVGEGPIAYITLTKTASRYQT